MRIKSKNIYENIQELMTAVKDGTASAGDELITSDIDGEAAFILIRIGKKKIKLIRKWMLKEKKPMRTDNFDLKKWLETKYRDSLPEELKTLNPKVRLLKEIEVFGKNEVGIKEKGKQIEYFKNVKHRITAFNSCDEFSRWWWLDTPCEEGDVVSATSFADVYNGGLCTSDGASNADIGVRPAFIISRS
ncbi:MAG: DUF6273 domain-containing protein [Lachnospiraceae bacterium]|nr:DUF6273 domain-containing protein [Lachnospiraceae bacterium]